MNLLTPAEIERLALLAEEAAEIVQITSKILRFGKQSFHPNDPTETTNIKLLEMECSHIMVAIQLLAQEDDIDTLYLEDHFKGKVESVNNYLEHNKVIPIE